MARLLLIDDDADILLLLEHILQGAGYHVDCAETVRSARSLLERRHYDLVIADGKLPDGTGMMVGKAAGAQGIDTLIVTGYAFQLPRDELLQYEYLLKPIRPSELLRAIEQNLKRPTRCPPATA